MADQIPIPDVSQLPDQSPANQFNLQNANAAMAPQAQAPNPEPPFVQDNQGATLAMGPSESQQGPSANPTALKSLLTNFFGGMGRSMMVHAGLPTPEEAAQKQQQMQIQQQNAQSLAGIRAAQQAATELHPYQMPDAPDGTPGQVIPTNAAGIRAIQVQQMKNAAKPGLEMATIGPEHAQLLPGIPVGTQVPKALLDKAMLGTASKMATQNNAPEKTPTEIALEIRRDQGDPAATRILARRHQEKEAERAAFPLNRPGAYIDPNTGQLLTATGGTAISQGYVPAGPGVPVMSKQAQFGEMKSASSKLRDSINNLDRDFTPSQIAKLQLAARAPDESVLRTVIDSTLGTENLTAAQQDYVIWLGQMNERLLSLRNVAGMGQGSQDLRSAIQATLPNMKVGSKGFALKKMDAVDNQIQTLERGIPKFKGGNAPNSPRRPTHRFNPATNKIEVIP